MGLCWATQTNTLFICGQTGKWLRGDGKLHQRAKNKQAVLVPEVSQTLPPDCSIIPPVFGLRINHSPENLKSNAYKPGDAPSDL